MALLFMDGFDVGDFTTKWVAVSSASSTTTRFNSGRSMLLDNYNNRLEKSFSASSEVYFGAAIMYSNATFRDPISIDNSTISFYGDSGTVRHVSITTNSLGQWVAYRGTTQIGITAPQLVAGIWNFVEVRVSISDTVGRCVLNINGTTLIDFTGDTKNAGTNTTVDKVRLSGISNFGTGQYYDDLYICDSTGSAPYNTFLGDTRVVTISPTSAGSTTQLTPDSGSNYARVNEIPYSSANYVSGSTPALRDTYTMSDLPANVATIYGVQNNVVAKRTSTGAIAIKPAIKSGAGVYYGSQTPVITTDVTYSDLRTSDPNTSAAWTVSGVNNLESGLEIA